MANPVDLSSLIQQASGALAAPTNNLGVTVREINRTRADVFTAAVSTVQADEQNKADLSVMARQLQETALARFKVEQEEVQATTAAVSAQIEDGYKGIEGIAGQRQQLAKDMNSGGFLGKVTGLFKDAKLAAQQEALAQSTRQLINIKTQKILESARELQEYAATDYAAGRLQIQQKRQEFLANYKPETVAKLTEQYRVDAAETVQAVEKVESGKRAQAQVDSIIEDRVLRQQDRAVKQAAAEKRAEMRAGIAQQALAIRTKLADNTIANTQADNDRETAKLSAMISNWESMADSREEREQVAKARQDLAEVSESRKAFFSLVNFQLDEKKFMADSEYRKSALERLQLNDTYARDFKEREIAQKKQNYELGLRSFDLDVARYNTDTAYKEAMAKRAGLNIRGSAVTQSADIMQQRLNLARDKFKSNEAYQASYLETLGVKNAIAQDMLGVVKEKAAQLERNYKLRQDNFLSGLELKLNAASLKEREVVIKERKADMQMEVYNAAKATEDELVSAFTAIAGIDNRNVGTAYVQQIQQRNPEEFEKFTRLASAYIKNRDTATPKELQAAMVAMPSELFELKLKLNNNADIGTYVALKERLIESMIGTGKEVTPAMRSSAQTVVDNMPAIQVMAEAQKLVTLRTNMAIAKAPESPQIWQRLLEQVAVSTTDSKVREATAKLAPRVGEYADALMQSATEEYSALEEGIFKFYKKLKRDTNSDTAQAVVHELLQTYAAIHTDITLRGMSDMVQTYTGKSMKLELVKAVTEESSFMRFNFFNPLGDITSPDTATYNLLDKADLYKYLEAR